MPLLIARPFRIAAIPLDTYEDYVVNTFVPDSFYRTNESSGTVLADYNGVNNGSTTNPISSGAAITNNTATGSVDLQGTNDITIPAPLSTWNAGDGFELSFWVEFDSIPSTVKLYEFDGSDHHIEVYTDGSYLWKMNSNSFGSSPTAPGTLVTGTPYFFSIWFCFRTAPKTHEAYRARDAAQGSLISAGNGATVWPNLGGLDLKFGSIDGRIDEITFNTFTYGDAGRFPGNHNSHIDSLFALGS